MIVGGRADTIRSHPPIGQITFFQQPRFPWNKGSHFLRIFFRNTPRKFNSSPLKNYHLSQKGKTCLPTIIFQGRDVKLRGVSFLPSKFVSSERKLAEISSWLWRLQAASSIYGAPMARKGKGMLVLLVVRSKSGEKTSWGKGRLPCYLQGFSYISGGLFRISFINLSNLSRI